MTMTINEDIKKACEVLAKGGVILYPTDTVWGIGCDATNAEAVKRVYEIKKRADIDNKNDVISLLKNYLLSPFESSKINFSILGIIVNGSDVVLVPYDSLNEAVQVSISSLYEVTEMIGKKDKDYLRSLYPYIEMLESLL